MSKKPEQLTKSMHAKKSKNTEGASAEKKSPNSRSISAKRSLDTKTPLVTNAGSQQQQNSSANSSAEASNINKTKAPATRSLSGKLPPLNLPSDNNNAPSSTTRRLTDNVIYSNRKTTTTAAAATAASRNRSLGNKSSLVSNVAERSGRLSANLSSYSGVSVTTTNRQNLANQSVKKLQRPIPLTSSNLFSSLQRETVASANRRDAAIKTRQKFESKRPTNAPSSSTISHTSNLSNGSRNLPTGCGGSSAVHRHPASRPITKLSDALKTTRTSAQSLSTTATTNTTKIKNSRMSQQTQSHHTNESSARKQQSSDKERLLKPSAYSSKPYNQVKQPDSSTTASSSKSSAKEMNLISSIITKANQKMHPSINNKAGATMKTKEFESTSSSSSSSLPTHHLSPLSSKTKQSGQPNELIDDKQDAPVSSQQLSFESSTTTSLSELSSEQQRQEQRSELTSTTDSRLSATDETKNTPEFTKSQPDTSTDGSDLSADDLSTSGLADHQRIVLPEIATIKKKTTSKITGCSVPHVKPTTKYINDLRCIDTAVVISRENSMVDDFGHHSDHHNNVIVNMLGSSETTNIPEPPELKFLNHSEVQSIVVDGTIQKSIINNETMYGMTAVSTTPPSIIDTNITAIQVETQKENQLLSSYGDNEITNTDNIDIAERRQLQSYADESDDDQEIFDDVHSNIYQTCIQNAQYDEINDSVSLDRYHQDHTDDSQDITIVRIIPTIQSTTTPEPHPSDDEVVDNSASGGHLSEKNQNNDIAGINGRSELNVSSTRFSDTDLANSVDCSIITGVSISDNLSSIPIVVSSLESGITPVDDIVSFNAEGVVADSAEEITFSDSNKYDDNKGCIRDIDSTSVSIRINHSDLDSCVSYTDAKVVDEYETKINENYICRNNRQYVNDRNPQERSIHNTVANTISDLDNINADTEFCDEDGKAEYVQSTSTAIRITGTDEDSDDAVTCLADHTDECYSDAYVIKMAENVDTYARTTLPFLSSTTGRDSNVSASLGSYYDEDKIGDKNKSSNENSDFGQHRQQQSPSRRYSLNDYYDICNKIYDEDASFLNTQIEALNLDTPKAGGEENDEDRYVDGSADLSKLSLIEHSSDFSFSRPIELDGTQSFANELSFIKDDEANTITEVENPASYCLPVSIEEQNCITRQCDTYNSRSIETEYNAVSATSTIVADNQPINKHASQCDDDIHANITKHDTPFDATNDVFQHHHSQLNIDDNDDTDVAKSLTEIRKQSSDYGQTDFEKEMIFTYCATTTDAESHLLMSANAPTGQVSDQINKIQPLGELHQSSMHPLASNDMQINKNQMNEFNNRICCPIKNNDNLTIKLKGSSQQGLEFESSSFIFDSNSTIPMMPFTSYDPKYGLDCNPSNEFANFASGSINEPSSDESAAPFFESSSSNQEETMIDNGKTEISTMNCSQYSVADHTTDNCNAHLNQIIHQLLNMCDDPILPDNVVDVQGLEHDQHDDTPAVVQMITTTNTANHNITNKSSNIASILKSCSNMVRRNNEFITTATTAAANTSTKSEDSGHNNDHGSHEHDSEEYQRSLKNDSKKYSNKPEFTKSLPIGEDLESDHSL